MDQAKIELLMRAAHEVNRAYCLMLGDDSQPQWERAADWQRVSIRNGVLGVFAGTSPEQSHERWMVEKLATGWKYGPVKDLGVPDAPVHGGLRGLAGRSAAQRMPSSSGSSGCSCRAFGERAPAGAE